MNFFKRFSENIGSKKKSLVQQNNPVIKTEKKDSVVKKEKKEGNGCKPIKDLYLKSDEEIIEKLNELSKPFYKTVFELKTQQKSWMPDDKREAYDSFISDITEFHYYFPYPQDILEFLIDSIDSIELIDLFDHINMNEIVRPSKQNKTGFKIIDDAQSLIRPTNIKYFQIIWSFFGINADFFRVFSLLEKNNLSKKEKEELESYQKSFFYLDKEQINRIFDLCLEIYEKDDEFDELEDYEDKDLKDEPNNKKKKSEVILWKKEYWNKALKQLQPSDSELIKECFTLSKFNIKITYDKNDKASVKLNPSLRAKTVECMFKSKKELNKIEKITKKELENEDFYFKVLVDEGLWPKDLLVKGRDLYKDFGVSNDTEDFGFLYFIRNKDIFKIGITTDLMRRMKQLNPDEIINTVKCSNYITLEKDLHKDFKKNRIPQTEYFRFTPQQVKQVNYKINQKALFK